MKIPRFPFVALCLLGNLSAPAAEKPNVLLICIDDLKPLLGCYGDPIAKTPAIDALAARSVQFNAAYCNQAVCAPSRNALLTGLRPQTLGIYDLGTNFRLSRPDAVTLTQTFMKSGYRAEGLGKILHVGHGNHEDAASWSVEPWKPKGPQYVLKESTATLRDGNNGARGAATESANVPDDTYGDGKIAGEAIQRLQAAKQNADTPFFLAVGFLKPHLPFVAPKKYWDLYDPAELPLATVRDVPEGAPSYAPQFGGELRQYSDIPKTSALSDDLQRELIHGYYAATSYTDAQIGRVLAELDHLGLAENTIVVLWGDHGWHLGDHGMWCKHTNYEQAARIPLLVAAPGSKQGAKTRSLVETVDLYPTLCELAGLPAPDGLDGRSFADMLKDPDQTIRDHVIHVYPRGQRLGRAIRTDRHRLVEWKVPGSSADSAELELYDYETDPLETKNLAIDQPETVANLRALLATHPEAKPQIAAKTTSKPKGGKDRNAMFDGRDTDKDGRLTREEFLKGQPDPDEAPKRFPKFDTNLDGVLSREEFVKPGGR
jgi:iduronate 2-sulfatase